MKVVERVVEHYNFLGRSIEWTFDGGEPLEMHDFPQILKYCKENNGNITLNSNGGRIWLDWWAIEPHVDQLNLSYHYWQKEHLIKFIIEVFKKKSKNVNVIVPLRPDFFDWDLERIIKLEQEYNIKVSKHQLYKDNSHVRGFFDYTDEQLAIINGRELIDEKNKFQETTFAERIEELKNESPVYLGKLCNLGVERLYITYDGWVTGSICNNGALGNIWDNTFQLRNSPSVCKMLACVNADDQQITKFP